MSAYAFWNNKGGTGKTSLAFQAISQYALENQHRRILVVDMCPQANLSELLLGGMTNNGSHHLLQRQGMPVRCSIGGYFQNRLPTPYQIPYINSFDYLTHPAYFNPCIPQNISLICGDPLLELQANAINTLANQQVPGTNTWIAVIDWLRDLLAPLQEHFDDLFIDCNPSFSIYTQIALSSVDSLILPVMADDSSRRAIQNAFSLVYGLRLPSPIYAEFAFASRLTAAGRYLPRVHMIVKNRLTQYMGPASAYVAVLHSIDQDVAGLLHTNSQMFTFSRVSDGMAEVRDFQTTGVVAFATGTPFPYVRSGRREVGGRRVRVNEEYRLHCIEAVRSVSTRL